MEKIIRVALIGPESSGKSTLAHDLAEHYNTVWVREFARNYISSLYRKYTEEDVLFCIEKQIQSEKSTLLQSNKILFSDTELILHKIWLEDVFKTDTAFLDKQIDEFKHDLYLLTKPDLEFVPDPVRENPYRREYFYSLYEKELKKRELNYAVIGGYGDARLKAAIEAVENYLKT